ncbi:MAG: hypothetical protein HEP71_20500 [Roseivirga sp.]|nr:hypothetical protein [Roseivirga sp.]
MTRLRNRAFYLVLTLLIIVSVVNSCHSARVVQPEDGAPVEEVINLLKQVLHDESIEEFQIEITNAHNGHYYLTSGINKVMDKIRLTTRTINRQGIEMDTSMVLQSDVFEERLNFELRTPKIALAGHYQTVDISIGETKYNFSTRRAFGLMSLLREGKAVPSERQRRQILNTNKAN